jgi:AcrR family transcriptional regulator
MPTAKTGYGASPVAVGARSRRAESKISDIAAVALALFEARGFGAVTVEDVATEAQISIRTFYRYFDSKEDLLVVKIRHRAEALASALADRPLDESPLHSVRMAVVAAVSAEDPASVEQWITVAEGAPGVLRTIMGANILEMNVNIAEFLASRLGMRSDEVVPATLAAAIGAVIQNAQTRWHFQGGDLVQTISEALEVLEEGFGTDFAHWSSRRRRPKSRPILNSSGGRD